MVTYILDEKNSELSVEELKAMEEAKDMALVYDDDCPELTPEMMEALKEARLKKPYRGAGKKADKAVW